MYEASVTSDLYHAGTRFDDGQPFVAEVYYVQIENERGRRFRHVAAFKGTNPEYCDETGEGPYFPDLREESLAKAEALAARVNAALAAGGKLSKYCWVETDPAYCSAEYQSQGTEYQRWMAEKEAA
jgi:hypothetical protein